MRSLEVVELFAGGGGASQGLRAAGWLATAHVEWDASAAATLSAAISQGRLDGDVIHGDVRTVDLSRFVGVDAVWSSFPCQAFSQAGSRDGALDERNGWPWTVRRLDELEPTWFLGENVPGLLSHAKRSPFCLQGVSPRVARFEVGPPPRVESVDGVMVDLPEGLEEVEPRLWGAVVSCPGCYFEHVVVANLRRRFRWVGWRALDAADWGAPQRRQRVYILAGPVPVEWPAPTHGELSLAVSKWVTQDYWRDQGIPVVGEPTRSERRLLAVSPSAPEGVLPWRTVRQALFPGRSCLVLGGGTNPHKAGEARTETDLSDRPSTTIPAVHGTSNALPVVVVDSAPEDRRHPDAEMLEGDPLDLVLVRDRGHGISDRHGPRPDSPVDAPAPTIAAGIGGTGPRLSVSSRSGRPQIEYPLVQPGLVRGPSDLVRRHPVEHPDLPASTVGAHRPSYMLQATEGGGEQCSSNLDFYVEGAGNGGGGAPRTVDAPSPSVSAMGTAYVSPASLHRDEARAPGRVPQSQRVLDSDRPCSALWGYDNRETPKTDLPVSTLAFSQPELLERPSPTVTTTESKGTRGDFMGRPLKSGGRRGPAPDRASDALWLAMGRRRLTPTECVVLMQWPADWPMQGTKTAHYRIAGNGCCPGVVEAVARAVIEADARWRRSS